MTSDAFEDPQTWIRDLPAVPKFFAHRVAVIVDPDAESVGLLMLNLPPGTLVYGAYTDRASMVTEHLQLHVCLVHQSLPEVPEMCSAPRVSVAEFCKLVRG